MSTLNDGPPKRPLESRTLYEESDRLLRLAEGLQDKCDYYERKRWMLIVLGIGTTIAAVAAAVAYLPLVSPLAGTSFTFWVALGSFYGFAGGVYLAYALSRMNRQLTRERRALHRIVDMLRDLEKGIAETNNLSPLEHAEFRIRLSRFDIGPGWSYPQPRKPQMSPLKTVFSDLSRLGYESVRIGTLKSPETPDPYHVYAVGRPNDRHVIIVREGPDGSCRIYTPFRGNLGDQAKALVKWLADNVGPAEEE
jgi:hypothetical protein